MGRTGSNLGFCCANICTWMFTAALFIIIESGKVRQPTLDKQNTVYPYDGVLLGKRRHEGVLHAEQALKT